LLVVLSIVMFVLEVKVTSFGMLTVGGVICLMLGSGILIDGPIPELRVPLQLVVPLSLALAAACAFAVRLVFKAQQDRVGTGVEGMTGETGTVTRTLDPEGRVFVHGEIWNASSEAGTIPQGGLVQVVRVDKMRLTVKPADDSAGNRS